MFDTAGLHEAIAAVCPIDGVSVGKVDDKATWRVDFSAAATAAQRNAAAAVMAGFDATLAPDTLTAWDMTSLKIAFNHENRIRALEGKAAITVAQFRAAVRAQL